MRLRRVTLQTLMGPCYMIILFVQFVTAGSSYSTRIHWLGAFIYLIKQSAIIHCIDFYGYIWLRYWANTTVVFFMQQPLSKIVKLFFLWEIQAPAKVPLPGTSMKKKFFQMMLQFFLAGMGKTGFILRLIIKARH